MRASTEAPRSRALVLAGVAVIVGLVVAAVGGLALVAPTPVVPPAGPAYTIALPEAPATQAPVAAAEAATPGIASEVAEADTVEREEGEPDGGVTAEIVEPSPAAPAAAPALLVVLSGLAWNEALADVVHRALPEAVAFSLPQDHPAAIERLGLWRGLGRDVLLRIDAAGAGDIEGLLQTYRAASGIIVADDTLYGRRDPRPRRVRYVDASLTDAAGYTATLRELMRDARALPPPIALIEVYPGLVPQLVAWLEQIERGGYRLLRPMDLEEAEP